MLMLTIITCYCTCTSTGPINSLPGTRFRPRLLPNCEPVLYKNGVMTPPITFAYPWSWFPLPHFSLSLTLTSTPPPIKLTYNPQPPLRINPYPRIYRWRFSI